MFTLRRLFFGYFGEVQQSRPDVSYGGGTGRGPRTVLPPFEEAVVTEPSLLLLILLGGLLLAAGALASAVRAVWALIAELTAALFANLRALAVIVLLIACVVAVALLAAPPTGPAVG